MNKVAILVSIIGLVAAQDNYKFNYNDVDDNEFPQDDEYQGDHGDEKDYHTEPHYSYGYEVHDDHTGDIKSHYEERKGDHTRGMYTLVEPGGSKRVVQYFVKGKSGFNAKVEREETKHPLRPSHLRGKYHDEAEDSAPSRPVPLRHYDDVPSRHFDYSPSRHYENSPSKHYEADSPSFGQRLSNYKLKFYRKPTTPSSSSNGYRSSRPVPYRTQNEPRGYDHRVTNYDHSPVSPSFSMFNSIRSPHHKSAPPPPRHEKPLFSHQSFVHNSFLADGDQRDDYRHKNRDPPAPSHATSSVKFITNGASLSTVTNHVMPETRNQYY